MYQVALSGNNPQVGDLQAKYSSESDATIEGWFASMSWYSGNPSVVVMVLSEQEWREVVKNRELATIIAAQTDAKVDPYAGKRDTLTHTAADPIPKSEHLRIRKRR